MIKLQYLLLVLLTAAGVWSVDVGTSVPEDENKLLVSSGAPVSYPSTSSPNNSQQLTNDSSEDYEDYEDYEDEEDDLLASEELEDGMLPAKVQQVVKPSNEGRKRKGSKKSRSKGKRKRTGKKKQKDPCKTDYKDYCIYGKCQYLKDLNQPSCVCLPGYQNERCGIQTLHVITEKRINSLSIVLVVGAVMLFIFIMAVIFVTLRTRRKMRVEHDVLNEEKQKLRTENGIVV
ncbi:amphiregulin-like [Mustelus asterias]